MTGAIAYADRREWIEARRNGIGGSDAAAILGVSPWRTPLDVWEDKMGVSEDRPPTPAMDWGNRLEAVVADAVAERLGVRLRRVRRILVHPEAPFVIGNLDRVAGRDTIVEIKTARYDDGWATEEEAPRLDPIDRVPRHYYVQGQHYALVTGRSRVVFGVLVGGSDLRVIETPADPGFGGDLLEAESEWWTTYVDGNVRPPLTVGDADRLVRLFPHGSGEKVATPEIDLWVEALLEARVREDEAAAERAEAELRIKEYLGDEASDLVSSVAKVTWRSSERSSTDWKAVAGSYRAAIDNVLAKAPDALGLGLDPWNQVRALEGIYTNTKPTRTFLVDRKGGKR